MKKQWMATVLIGAMALGTMPLSAMQAADRDAIVTADAVAVTEARQEALTAEAVVAKIAGIGEVTLEKEALVKAAREAYNALPEAEKQQVQSYKGHNYLEDLTLAEAHIGELTQDMIDHAAALAVEKKIDAIGAVDDSDACKQRIETADRAYNALTAHQQKLVPNVQKLTDAKKAYSNIATVRFVDVPKTAWFAHDVNYVIERDIMKGTASNMFSPNSTTTRGMLVSMLYNLEGKPEITVEADFVDVDAREWFVSAVHWAATNGIVSGYEDGTFRPYDKVTRQEMAAFLYRYAEYKQYDCNADVDLHHFSDADEIGAWAESAMKWANTQKLINGLPDGTLAPKGTATRAQVAAIITRFCEHIAK